MAYKVVVNRCYGGFSLSARAESLLRERFPGLVDEHDLGARDVPRHHPGLVAVVEELGAAASGGCAKVCVEVIDTPMYRIDEYDGMESVETLDTIDWIDASAVTQ